MTDLDLLKFNLSEDDCPFFTDAQLNILLEQHSTVEKASYHGCMIKARDDSAKIGAITTASNERYWLRRARMFQKNSTGIMKRVDEP